MRLIDAEEVVKAIDRHTFDTDDGLCLDEDITIILEEVPSAQPKKGTEERTETYACDSISRQAAIDELDHGTWGKQYDKALAKAMLESLPTAQPVITCDGCKFVGTYDTDFPCRNCIRREKDYYAQE